MAEIKKAYKEYGESVGHQYLTLFYNYSIISDKYTGKTVDDRFYAFKKRFEQYVKREYGRDFYSSYEQFALQNRSNTKLLNELEKKRGEFLNGTILDLAEEPAITVKTNSTMAAKPKHAATTPTQNNTSPTIKKPEVQSENEAKSGHGNVYMDRLRAEFDYDNPQRAIPFVKSMIFRHPHDERNWCVLGDLYAKMEKWETAYTYYEKALEINPKLEQALAGKQNVTRQMKSSTTGGSTVEVQDHKEPETAAKDESPAEETEAYFFENHQEFILYTQTKNNDKNVTWLSGSDYQDAFQKGYKLFDQKQYAEAIDAYKEALKLNPIGVTARFEICMSYCQLHNLSAARDMLQSTVPYLYSDLLLAKYYRTLGYILIDEKQYRLAAHCYQYSLYFDPDQPTAKQEILFVINQEGFEILEEIRDRSSVESVLEKADMLVTAVELPNEEEHAVTKIDSDDDYEDEQGDSIENSINGIIDLYDETYFQLRSALETTKFWSSHSNDTIIPLLVAIGDYIQIRKKHNSEYFLQQLKPWVQDTLEYPQRDNWLNDFLKFYKEIIRGDFVRGEWITDHDTTRFKNDPISRCVVAFGDYIVNPHCIVDYKNAPYLELDFNSMTSFADIMISDVVSIINKFCEKLSKRKLPKEEQSKTELQAESIGESNTDEKLSEYQRVVKLYGKAEADQIINDWAVLYYVKSEGEKTGYYDTTNQLLMGMFAKLQAEKGMAYYKKVACLYEQIDEEKLAKELDVINAVPNGKYQWGLKGNIQVTI